MADERFRAGDVVVLNGHRLTVEWTDGRQTSLSNASGWNSTTPTDWLPDPELRDAVSSWRSNDPLDVLAFLRGATCTNFTTGLGSCFRNGRSPDAQYGAVECCVPCIADAALARIAAAPVEELCQYTRGGPIGHVDPCLQTRDDHDSGTWDHEFTPTGASALDPLTSTGRGTAAGARETPPGGAGSVGGVVYRDAWDTFGTKRGVVMAEPATKAEPEPPALTPDSPACNCAAVHGFPHASWCESGLAGVNPPALTPGMTVAHRDGRLGVYYGLTGALTPTPSRLWTPFGSHNPSYADITDLRPVTLVEKPSKKAAVEALWDAFEHTERWLGSREAALVAYEALFPEDPSWGGAP